MGPGRNKSSAAERGGGAVAALFAAGRLVGFLALVLPSLAGLAGLVLLPAYADMRQAEYAAELAKVEVAELEATKAANARLASDADNPILLKRIMRAQSPGVIRGEEFIATGVQAPAPPGAVAMQRLPRPAPPNDWALNLAKTFANETTRRGVFLIAIGAVITALFLFSPPDKYVRKVPT